MVFDDMERPIVLVCDLDGTVLGCEESTIKFSIWVRDNINRLTIIYATGRLRESAKKATQDVGLPMPTAAVTGIGTEISTAGFQCPVMHWPSCTVAKNWDVKRTKKILEGLKGIELQPESVQNLFKVSFYLTGSPGHVEKQILSRLQHAGIKANVIVSGEQFVDILPIGVNKGTALCQLLRTLNLSESNVMIAGDSCNDISMLSLPYPSIIVGNAELRLLYHNLSNVYYSDAPFASGVIEGVGYWEASWRKL